MPADLRFVPDTVAQITKAQPRTFRDWAFDHSRDFISR